MGLAYGHELVRSIDCGFLTRRLGAFGLVVYNMFSMYLPSAGCTSKVALAWMVVSALQCDLALMCWFTLSRGFYLALSLDLLNDTVFECTQIVDQRTLLLLLAL